MPLSKESTEKLKRSICLKLSQECDSSVDIPVDELCNYALLNIERNHSFEETVLNLKIFMGDFAVKFSKWLFAMVRKCAQSENPRESEMLSQDDPSLGDNENSLSHFEAELDLSIDRDDRLYDEIVRFERRPHEQQSVIGDNKSIKRRLGSRTMQTCRSQVGAVFLSSDQNSDEEDFERKRSRKLSSVVSSRAAHYNRNNHFSMTNIFLKAVGEANKSVLSRRRRAGVGDLREKLNAKRQQRALLNLRNGCTLDPVSCNSNRNAFVPDAKETVRMDTSNISLERKQKRLARFENTHEFIQNYLNEPPKHVTEESTVVQSIPVEVDKAESLSEENPVIKKKKIRCKFWPNCAKADSCEYVHPSESCRLYPNCKYGSNCFYIHPTCPDDGQCNKANCNFTHYKKNVVKIDNIIPKATVNVSIPQPSITATTTEITEVAAVTSRSVPTPTRFNYNAPFNPRPPIPVIYNMPYLGPRIITPFVRSNPVYKINHLKEKKLCKDFPNCSSTDCKLFHPQPCAFGSDCRNKRCLNIHPTKSQSNQFKWIKPKETENPSAIAESVTPENTDDVTMTDNA